MDLRPSRTLAVCGIGLIFAAVGAAAAIQNLIFSDGFESGDATAWSFASEICGNGIDEDGDGFVDCDDFDCDEDPACV